MADSAKTLISDKKNVYIFNKAEELVSLINILNSEITEDLINEIFPEAKNLFFVPEEKNTFYYTEEIQEKLKVKFPTEMALLSEGSETRQDKVWWVNPPGFEKKEKQKIFWKTLIELEFETFKNTLDTLSLTRKKESNGVGQSRFEVIWSTTLTTTKKLKTLKLESLKYIDTIFS